MESDVAALKALYDEVEPVFSKASGNVFHYNDLKSLESVIVDIENFEKNDLKKVESEMDKFSKKYGSTKPEIDKKETKDSCDPDTSFRA